MCTTCPSSTGGPSKAFTPAGACGLQPIRLPVAHWARASARAVHRCLAQDEAFATGSYCCALGSLAVRETIKKLVHSQMPPTLGNITECLRREGVEEPASKTLLNLCHMFSDTMCLWVPEEGDMSIVLLEEPLPPLPEKIIQELHMAVVRRLKHKSNMMNLACMREAADPSSRDWAEELARDGVTTLMIKNLPTSLQQPQVMDEIDNTGFGGKYDFFHMPGNFTGHHKSLGYAFLNLKDVQSMKYNMARH
ncbi:unnamed protein product [Durusdinium trenchii]|uniref:Mei2-like C-terminal RNA recognition motif domain-containing protein n=1 Tax=Durusdinium trenchii TaxID=1381693 RepID=A0ABP0RPR0_9DINO